MAAKAGCASKISTKSANPPRVVQIPTKGSHCAVLRSVGLLREAADSCNRDDFAGSKSFMPKFYHVHNKKSIRFSVYCASSSRLIPFSFSFIAGTGATYSAQICIRAYPNKPWRGLLMGRRRQCLRLPGEIFRIGTKDGRVLNGCLAQVKLFPCEIGNVGGDVGFRRVMGENFAQVVSLIDYVNKCCMIYQVIGCTL